MHSFLFLIPLLLNNSGEGPRVRRPQSPPRTRESPPTRDVPSGHTRDPARGHGLAAAASPHIGGRATPSPNSRLERSLTASQDPEHSLTEYIHQLEVIQQRLGGALPDSPSKKSCHQKIKQWIKCHGSYLRQFYLRKRFVFPFSQGSSWDSMGTTLHVRWHQPQMPSF